MKKTIILGIITYNRIHYIQKLITSFIENYNDAYNWIIIIADDGSTDSTVEWLDGLLIPDVDIIIIKNNRGFITRQSNSILEVAYVLDFYLGFMVNDDIVFESKDWATDYITAYELYNLDHLVYFNKKYAAKDALNMINKIKESDKSVNLRGEINAENCMGCLWTFTKKLIDNVGYFDEINFKGSGYSHREYTLRCCRAGFNNQNNLYDVPNPKISLFCAKSDPKYYTVKDNKNILQNKKAIDNTIKNPTIIKKDHLEKYKNIQINSMGKIVNMDQINKLINGGNNVMLHNKNQ